MTACRPEPKLISLYNLVKSLYIVFYFKSGNKLVLKSQKIDRVKYINKMFNEGYDIDLKEIEINYINDQEKKDTLSLKLINIDSIDYIDISIVK